MGSPTNHGSTRQERCAVAQPHNRQRFVVFLTALLALVLGIGSDLAGRELIDARAPHLSQPVYGKLLRNPNTLLRRMPPSAVLPGDDARPLPPATPRANLPPQLPEVDAIVGSYSYATLTGGVAFGTIARPASTSLEVSGLRYESSRPDGQRLVVQVSTNGVPTEVVGAIPDWLLVPIARFAGYNQAGAFTAFGQLEDAALADKLKNASYYIYNYHAHFENTLLGLRLMQADMLILRQEAADLPRIGGTLLLGLGESAPDVTANQNALAAFHAAAFPTGGQVFRSYIITDAGQDITFSVSGGSLTIGGFPYWSCWMTPSYSPTQIATIENDANNYGNATLQAEYDADQLTMSAAEFAALYTVDYQNARFEQLWDKKISESMLVRLPDLSARVSSEVRAQGGINPVVYSALTNTLRYAAFFRRAALLDPAMYARFAASLDCVKATPWVDTPAAWGGQGLTAPDDAVMEPALPARCTPVAGTGGGGATGEAGLGGGPSEAGSGDAGLEAVDAIAANGGAAGAPNAADSSAGGNETAGQTQGAAGATAGQTQGAGGAMAGQTQGAGGAMAGAITPSYGEATAADKGGGCGCRTARPGSTGPWAGLILFAIVGCARRRRMDRGRPGPASSPSPIEVFVSFRTTDALFVRRVFAALKRQGLAPWNYEEVAKGIVYGAAVDAALIARIEDSDLFIPIVTSESLSDASVNTRTEVAHALERALRDPGFFILPIVASSAPPPSAWTGPYERLGQLKYMEVDTTATATASLERAMIDLTLAVAVPYRHPPCDLPRFPFLRAFYEELSDHIGKRKSENAAYMQLLALAAEVLEAFEKNDLRRAKMLCDYFAATLEHQYEDIRFYYPEVARLAVALATGANDDVERIATRLLDHPTRRDDPSVALAVTAFRRGDYAAAAAHYDAAIALASDPASMAGRLASRLLAGQEVDVDAALSALDSMTVAASDVHALEALKAYALLVQNRPADAVTRYAKLNREELTANQTVCYATALSKSGRQSEAIALLRSGIEKDERNVDLRETLVAELQDGPHLANLPAAIAEMVRVAGDSRRHLGLAMQIYWQLSRQEESRALADRVLGMGLPITRDECYQVGAANWILGRRERADYDFERCGLPKEQHYSSTLG
jgi:tetratricopeptide (TPR) repeat protein